MRALLLYNLTATTTTPRLRDAVTTTLADNFDLLVQPTRARGHAAEIAADAVRAGVEVVFALGGDGTANEAVQGLAGTETIFAHVPGGGTNVLARALGLPNHPIKACLRYCELASGAPRAIGLGRATWTDSRATPGSADDRWFTFIAGLGFDAAIVERVEQRPMLKRVGRQLAFVWSGFAEWFDDGAGVPAEVEAVLPDGSTHGPASVAIVGNTDPYTYLGPRPLRITPQATFDTGLDLMTVGAVSTATILGTLGRAFGDARHIEAEHVGHWHDLEHLELRSARPLPLMVDGEHLGDTTSVHLRAQPDALLVLA